MRDPNYTNEQAFLSFQKGEEKGFAHFFHLHYRRMLFYAKEFIANEAVAEDITEECFLKFWQKRQEIKSAESIKSFLYSSIRNACLNQIRTNKFQQDAREEYGYLLLSDKDDTSLTRVETVARVLNALEELPSGSRKVFELFYFGKKSYREISQILGISENTVRNQKVRGLFLLRKKLLPLLLPLLNWL